MIIVALKVRTAAAWTALREATTSPDTMFVPTTTPLAEGDVVVVEVASPQLPNRVLVRGEVLAWRPARPRLRIRAGAHIRATRGEATKLAFLDDAMTGTLRPARRRQSRLPVSMPVRYRVDGTTGWHDAELRELSTGGALIAAAPARPPPLATKLTLEVEIPGSSAPLAIAATVEYAGAAGTSGLRFRARDSAGLRRLQELMRRVRSA